MNWFDILYIGQGKGWKLERPESEIYTIDYYPASEVVTSKTSGQYTNCDVVVLEAPRTPQVMNDVFGALERMRSEHPEVPVIYAAPGKVDDALSAKLNKAGVYCYAAAAPFLNVAKNDIRGCQTPAIARVVDNFRIKLAPRSLATWGGFRPTVTIDTNTPRKTTIYYYDPSKRSEDTTVNLYGFWPRFLATELAGMRLCGRDYLFNKARDLGARCDDRRKIVAEIKKFDAALARTGLDVFEYGVHRRGLGFVWGSRTKLTPAVH